MHKKINIPDYEPVYIYLYGFSVGNSPARYIMAETLKDAFNNVEGIKVKYFRRDYVAYLKRVIVVLENQGGLEFFIRNMSSPD